MTRRWTWIVVGFAGAAAGCGGSRRDANVSAPEAERPDRSLQRPASAPAPLSMEEAEMDIAESKKVARRAMAKASEIGELQGAGGLGLVGSGGGGRRARAPGSPETLADIGRAPTRSWFPETFLFAPLVVTDAAGAAKLSVRVPDRLTNWRILALAHSRAGGQAGAETMFQGTLPIYVDPVVPAFLSVGDSAQIPIQIVNTTDTAMAVSLGVEVAGATVSGVPSSVRVEGQDSQVIYASLRPVQPGHVKLTATVAGKDAVERTFPVQATGRPVIETRGGTLGAPRKVAIALSGKVEAAGAKARLLLFSGAHAVMRAELAGAVTRAAGGTANADAYTLLLAARVATLLGPLGADATPEMKDSLRALSIVAGQRVIRAARSPDALSATLLAEAALAHPDNPILARLGERLAETIASAQRPDGTFAGGEGWTLQRLLVGTAECVTAVRASDLTPAARQRTARVMIKASGAFERNLARVDDGYTAAALLVSGVVEGEPAARLRKIVRDAVQQDPDGLRSLTLKSHVLRGDGTTPTRTEATALAILALREDTESNALVADLGARVLSNYDPTVAIGDGRTDWVALKALLALFSGEIPAQVAIRFMQDGKVLAEQTFDRTKLRETLTLESPLERADGAHVYEIQAEPPVPGLGFRLMVQGFVPWEAKPSSRGLDLSITGSGKARVGQPFAVTVQAAAPAGMALTIQHRLPAGVQPDKASLDALVSDQTLRSFEIEDGRVTLEIGGLPAGQAFSALYRVIPTLAGTLNAPASTLTAGGIEQHVPSPRWVVAR